MTKNDSTISIFIIFSPDHVAIRLTNLQMDAPLFCENLCYSSDVIAPELYLSEHKSVESIFEEKNIPDMSLLKAFSILLCGPAEIIGPGYKWKQSILNGAIILTLASPFFAFLNSIPFQGATPPGAPIIKSKGVFVFGDDRRGLKSHPFIDFRSEEGKIYRLQDYIGYDEIFKFNENNPDHQEVLVEGFSLRNGLGRFWPTQVTTIDGKVLLDKDKQNTALIRYKDPFDGSLFIMYVVAGSLWIVSAVNAVQIMKKSP